MCRLLHAPQRAGAALAAAARGARHARQGGARTGHVIAFSGLHHAQRAFSAEAAIAAVPAEDAAGASATYAKASSLIDAAVAGEEVNMDDARELLRAAAAAGHPAAVGRLGRWHLFGLYGVPRDLRRALHLLHASASGGDVEAAYWLGHALVKMDDLVEQERALDAAVRASGVGDASAASASGPAPGSAGMLSSVPSASSPDPTRDESEAEASSRVLAAQAVILDIMAQRKRNRAAKGAAGGRKGKDTGAVVGGAAGPPSAPPSPASSSVGLPSFDASTLPLRSNPALAYTWLLKAAAAEHGDAMVSLGNLCMAWEGRGAGPLRVAEAVQWYELAARLPPAPVAGSQEEGGAPSSSPDAASSPPGGHPDAQYNLGMVYWEGVPGEGGRSGDMIVDRDRPRALQAFLAAAEQGDASACMFLGHAYRTGPPGVRVNVRRALCYLELASGSGHGGASHYLAQLWRDGDGSIGLKPEPGKARFFLDAACEADVAEAWAEKGDLLLNGEGGGGGVGGEAGTSPPSTSGVDLPAALHAYERAGSLGHASALVSAGVMHYRGLGTRADAGVASERYRAAGEMGSAEGWDNLAALHARGEGVQQSVQAARAYKALADRLRSSKEADDKGEAGSVAGGAPAYVPSAQKAGGDCGKSTCGCKQ